MKTKFTVDFFSDEKYEYLTAEISYDGQILCQVNQDQGKGIFEIEFFHEQYVLDKQPRMKFIVGDFISVLEDVKNELKNSR